MKVDPDTDAVVGMFPVGTGLFGVRAGYGGVWIAKMDANSVWRRIDRVMAPC